MSLSVIVIVWPPHSSSSSSSSSSSRLLSQIIVQFGIALYTILLKISVITVIHPLYIIGTLGTNDHQRSQVPTLFKIS